MYDVGNNVHTVLCLHCCMYNDIRIPCTAKIIGIEIHIIHNH